MNSLIVFLSLISTICLNEANATATLEITLTTYTNPGGKVANGGNCEPLSVSPCDHRFYFGLDQLTGDVNNAKQNSIMVKVTGEFPDSNTDSFQTNADNNGVYNPITQNFPSWPGGVLFKVYIEDVDVLSPEFVDKIGYRLVLTPSKQKDASEPTPLTLSGMRTSTTPTRLAISIRLYCDKNFFGTDCSTYCEPKNDNSGHFTCDPDTGAIICRPKWEDATTQCTIFSDDCVDSRCQNGGICVDGFRNYTCTCLAGYTGRFCEVNINDCTPGRCRNSGVCTDLINDFSCNCLKSFVGKTCNSTACTENNPCLNGGTCYGESNCYCTRGFTGPFCSTAACTVIPCANGGVCGLDGLCICPVGTLGDQCEVLVCNIIAPHCKNGATCNKGKCVCPLGFEGELCEINIWCKSVICQHDGTCVTEVGPAGWTPRCLCASNFTGERCEIYSSRSERQGQSLALPPQNNYGFLDLTEGKLMLAFICLSVILIVIIIILSICLCFRKNESKSKSTHVESHEISIISSNPQSTVSSLPPKFQEEVTPRSPPPKYMDNINSSKYANHYMVEDAIASQSETDRGTVSSSSLSSVSSNSMRRLKSAEDSVYASLDDSEVFLKTGEENKLNCIVEGKHSGVKDVYEIDSVDGNIK